MVRSNTTSTSIPVVYFPRSDDLPPDPVPYLMTEAEFIRFSRIDLTDVERPSDTVARYRKSGHLRFVQVGRDYRYTLPDAIDFVARVQGTSGS